MKARRAPHAPLGVFSALAFNVCLVAAALAAALAFAVISRDQLYAYELSPAGQKLVRERVEALAGDLITLDFDRHQQWDDMIASQLMTGDIHAARGLLLSARRMLAPQDANQLDRRLGADASDAEIELAALDLLTPGTRVRYEGTAPLLSRRSASGAGQMQAPSVSLGDQRDFEILARALMSDGDTDSMHLTLTGLGLGLGGEFTPRMAAGASALMLASRRGDFQASFRDEMSALIEAAAPPQRIQQEAARLGGDAGAFAVASAAFTAALLPAKLAAVKAALDQIGIMAEKTSPASAAIVLTHARSLSDLPRLRLVTQAAGDRAVAAAMGIAHDGRLARAARGELRFTRELAILLAVLSTALLALAWLSGFALVRLARPLIARLRRREDGYEIDDSELVESFGGTWTPL